MEPKRHILVVEDDAAARDALKILLKAAGYSVVCVTNGREGLDRLSQAEPPFVILLDTNMPVLDGWQFRREQRQTPHLAGIPILVFSGEADLTRVASMGAACFPRPVAFGGLLEAVRVLDEGPAHA
jgi:CheY-like chemotaxis protein